MQRDVVFAPVLVTIGNNVGEQFVENQTDLIDQLWGQPVRLAESLHGLGEMIEFRKPVLKSQAIARLHPAPGAKSATLDSAGTARLLQ